MDNSNSHENNTAIIDRRMSRSAQDPLQLSGNEKRKTVFIGLNAGAGTTTLALAYADYLAASYTKNLRALKRKRISTMMPVAFVEINDENKSLSGMTYDRVGIDKRFIGREFVSFYHLVSKGQSIRQLSNPDAGINWALQVPGEGFDRQEITRTIRLSENVQGINIVTDINGNYGNNISDEDRIKELRTLLTDSDMVVVVVDPLPSSLMADRSKFALLKSLEATGVSVKWIINKMNSGVNVKEMRNYLQLREYLEIPFFEASEIYSAQYNCKTMISQRFSSDVLKKCFNCL